MSPFPNIPPSTELPRQVRGRRHLATWQLVALWIAAALVGVAALFVIGVFVALHSQRVHNYVLTQARKSVTESLGVPLEIQSYALHFSGISPTLDIYGLTVHGAAPYTDPPLLQAPRARIGVQIVSLVSRKWYLSEITIHHPVVQLRVDENGNTNLPKPKQTTSQTNGVQTLFDLAIRRAMLDAGEIYYNDRKSLLDADIRDLALNAAYNPSRHTYTGHLAYGNGHVRSGAHEPIPHALSAEFEMSPTHLDLRKADVRSESSLISLTATVDDFNNPQIKADYHALLCATDLRKQLHNASLPVGTIQLDGRVKYAINAGQTALDAVTLNGTLRSDRLEVTTQSGRIEIRAIRGTYGLANGNAEVRSLTASLLGGTVDTRAMVSNVSGDQTGTVHLKLDGISLADLKQLAQANSGAANNVTLEGTLRATSDATWKGSINTLLATADATINAAAGSTQSQNTLPIDVSIHASFRNSDQQLTLHQSYLRTPQTTLTLDGTTGKASQINVALITADLHELESIAAIFSKPSQPFGLYGTAQFSGTLSGRTTAPRLTGDLSGANIRLRGTEWRLLGAHLSASPSLAEIQGGQLIPVASKGAPRGNIAFSGRVQLKNWSFAPDSPFQVTLNAQHLDAGQLARVAGSTTPVGGTLDVNLQAHGTQLNPIGQGNAQLTRAVVAGETILSATIQFSGDGNAAHATLNLTMPAGVTSGQLTYYPKQRGYEFQLQAHDFKLDQLQTVKTRNLSIAGVVNLLATGRGTLDDPQLNASVEVPQLQAKGQAISNLALGATVANHLANITFDTRAINSNVHGQAKIQVVGDYYAEATLDTQAIPLQPLVATYSPVQAQNIAGQTELHATLRGPLKRRDAIEAHLVIPDLNVHYQNTIQLAAAGPIRADYANGVLTLQRSAITGTGTDLQFQGSVPILDHTKPVALLLLGSVDLKLVQLFNPDIASSGQLRFNINSFGARTDPNVQGTVQIVNASLATPDAPLGLSHGNGTLELTRDRLNIARFEGVVGGGKVTARGGVVYHPAIQFDLALAGKGIRLLYPEGVREETSTNLTLTGTPEQAALRGQVNVDQISFTPDFDISTLTSLGNEVEVPPSHGFENILTLNVAVRSTQNVNLVSRTVSVNGSANLTVTGTAAEPVVLGRINLTGGDLIFKGNRYVLQNGIIDFVNPTRTEPNLNANLTSTIQQYNIGLRFEGPLDSLRTTYTSDPALPPADIINLIAFGKTQEASATAAPTNQTAEQSIASAVSGEVTSRVEKIAGISHLSVDPTLGTNQQSAGATITVQQRVTSKIFVTFSTDVTSTQRQVIQLQYQATPRVSVSGTRDQNGGFGFDTRIRREW